MNCQQVQESLGDHSIGLLEPERLSAFERHVARCADCARTLRQFQRCMDLLDHMARPQPPDDLWQGVRARMELERSLAGYAKAAPAAASSVSWWTSAAAAMAGFAAAAAIMVGMATQQSGPTVLATAPPVAISVSQHTSMDSNSPVADGASVVAADLMSLRPVPGRAPYGRVIVPGREVLGEPIPTLATGAMMSQGFLVQGVAGRREGSR